MIEANRQFLIKASINEKYSAARLLCFIAISCLRSQAEREKEKRNHAQIDLPKFRDFALF